jgi:antitoxin CcdA
MRTPLFDPTARRKTVSLTLNSDLVAKARGAGINLSRIAEAAIAAEFQRVDREQWIADWAEAVRWTDAYVAAHGRPFDDWASDDAADDATDHAA